MKSQSFSDSLFQRTHFCFLLCQMQHWRPVIILSSSYHLLLLWFFWSSLSATAEINCKIFSFNKNQLAAWFSVGSATVGLPVTNFSNSSDPYATCQQRSKILERQTFLCYNCMSRIYPPFSSSDIWSLRIYATHKHCKLRHVSSSSTHTQHICCCEHRDLYIMHSLRKIDIWLILYWIMAAFILQI